MLWLKALHIMAVIAWMAGLFYLPRLYVYHADAKPGSELSETFKVMEQRLLRIIMNPAMLTVWVTGPLLAGMQGKDVYTAGWFLAKMLLVVLMTGFHMALAKWRKEFASGTNTRPGTFYRMANEFPTVLMALIVLLVILKPF